MRDYETVTAEIDIPAALHPVDGRFGSGPSKVRLAALDALRATGRTLMGTSHRQPPVRQLVARVGAGFRQFFPVPADYEVVLGNGGATAFWEVAAFNLIRRRSQHLSFGEFSAKFAAASAAAPFLDDPSVLTAAAGALPQPRAEAGVDVYAWPHNETSTGVLAPVQRVPGADDGALVLVDATSAAGGVCRSTSREKPTPTTSRRRRPSAPTAGSGWRCSRRRRSRTGGAAWRPADRWVPESLSLSRCRSRSTTRGKDETLQHPGRSPPCSCSPSRWTWLNWSRAAWTGPSGAPAASPPPGSVYVGRQDRPWAAPFVTDPAARSLVVATVDLDARVDAARVASTLRRNGIVDVEPYRKLGRNQLRIATYPAIDPDDVEALTHCVDYVVERLA